MTERAESKALKDTGNKTQSAIAGCIGGLFSRFCIAPLDVIKIRLQLQTHSFTNTLPADHGTIPVIKSIFRNHGITGFWRGNLPAELLYMTYGGTQFVAYRTISQALEPLPIPLQGSAFIAGAVGGTAATIVTYPLDLLRTRFAAQGTTKVYRSFLASFTQIARQEGPRGFFYGVGAGVSQIVPNMGLFFAIYETIRPRMKDLELPFGSGDAVAGMLASGLAKTGVFPLDLIRKRLQVQGPARTKFADGAVPVYERGVVAAGRDIVSREGWRGLYRGLTIGILKAAPTSAITMWAYGVALAVLQDREIFA